MKKTPQSDDIKKEISNYLAELLKMPISEVMEINLISAGFLDSINVLQLVMFLEDKYNVDFSDNAFDQYEFDTVDGIVKIVQCGS